MTLILSKWNLDIQVPLNWTATARVVSHPTPDESTGFKSLVVYCGRQGNKCRLRLHTSQLSATCLPLFGETGMRVTKKQEKKENLLRRIEVLCGMNEAELRAEMPRVCGFKSDDATERELRWVLCKFAILTELA